MRSYDAAEYDQGSKEHVRLVFKSGLKLGSWLGLERDVVRVKVVDRVRSRVGVRVQVGV